MPGAGADRLAPLLRPMLTGIGLLTSALCGLVAMSALAGGGRPIAPLLAGLAGVVVLATFSLLAGLATTTPRLRVVEAVIFAALAAFVAVRGGDSIGAATSPALAIAAWDTTVVQFLLIIGGYAMLVPGSPARSAVFIGLLTAVPLAMILVVRSRSAEVADAIGTGRVASLAGLLVLGDVLSMAGTSIISMFRNNFIAEKELGMYDLERPIGQGGMGEVWLARHQRLARPAAIKLVRRDRLEGLDSAEAARLIGRFELEARATASLRSPNTIEIYDFGVAGTGTFYYVMEYLQGVDFRKLVNEAGPLPAGRVIYLVSQVCESLEEAHGQKLIHRDIKPANLHCGRLGVRHDFVKVLDFGLVKPIDAVPGAAELSLEGIVQGTPAFMAPELATGESAVDQRSDIYALGCVAYFMTTGLHVFSGATPMQVAIAHVTTEPVPPSHRCDAAVPDELEQIIMRCLAKNPDDRYQNARALRDALEACTYAAAWDSDLAASWWQEHAALLD